MFPRSFRSAAAGLCLALAFSVAASGGSEASDRVRLPPMPATQTAWQTETGLTSHPIGWEGFCKKYGNHCRLRDQRTGVVKLDERTWSLILKINTDVNSTIKPLSDKAHWGVAESWDIPRDGYGDCEDYALLKRKRLHETGLPLASLMMTVVRDLEGAGHAVLTVRTDRGDFVLDNKRNRVLNWSHTGYSYIKRQANLNPNRWVSIGTTPPAALTAAQ